MSDQEKELHEIKPNPWAAAIGKTLTGVEPDVEAPSPEQIGTRLTFTDEAGGCVQLWIYSAGLPLGGQLHKLPIEVVVDEEELEVASTEGSPSG